MQAAVVALGESTIEIPETIVNPNNNQTYTVTKIGRASFSNDSILTSVLIPKTIEFIDSFAFRDCVSLRNIEFENNSLLQTIHCGAFENCRSLQALELPNSVVSIEDYALHYCSNLTSLILSQNLEQIFEKSFNGLSSLKYVKFNTALPPTIKKADQKTGDIHTFEVFENTPVHHISLFVPKESVNNYNVEPWKSFKEVTDIDPVYKVIKVDNLFYQVIDKELMTVRLVNENWPNGGYSPANVPGGDINIPESITHPLDKKKYSITEVGKYCFSSNNSLTGVYFPKTIEQIDSFAFRECRNLKTVEFEAESSLKRINRSAFEYCHSLKQIVLPKNVETIEDWAFLDCRNLETVTLGQNIRELYEFSFRDCVSLEELKIYSMISPSFKSSEPRNPIPAWVFYGTPINNTELLVPIGAKNNYTGIPWSGFKKITERDIHSLVETTKENIRISRNGSQLELSNIKVGTMVYIHDVSGRLMLAEKSSSGSIGVNLQKGIYIISIDNKTQRISI